MVMKLFALNMKLFLMNLKFSNEDQLASQEFETEAVYYKYETGFKEYNVI